jgi:hypothetical protein
MSAYDDMSRDELLASLRMFAANWLAHDGCWFLAAEERFGIDSAIDPMKCRGPASRLQRRDAS